MIIKNILFKFIDLNSSQYINNVSFQCTTQFKKKKSTGRNHMCIKKKVTNKIFDSCMIHWKIYNYYIYEIYNLLLVMTVKLQLIDLPRAYLT